MTAVELLPVHHFIRDNHLIERGLTNYWGYNSIGFFAPDIRYATSSDSARHVWEFKTMVKTLHSAGIEVILDVVYNHTGEGNHLGPTLSFRGIDNASYYRLMPDHPRYYLDYTGCGNTLNVRHPRVLQLIMDSLRYWVLEMHVDGFRFDLASTLARELHDVDRLSAFFDIIHQDPVLSQVKLIAEPWDLGRRRLSGRQLSRRVGRVERQISRRDPALLERRRRAGGGAGLPAVREQRSVRRQRPPAPCQHQFRHRARRIHACTISSRTTRNTTKPTAKTIVTAPTTISAGTAAWRDPTTKAVDLALRERQKRNMLATLLLSQGVPMLCGGDEMGRDAAWQQQRLLSGQ